MDIENLRKEIDRIDDQIASLYDRRMEMVKSIGIEKAKENKNVLDTSREREILARVTKAVNPDVRVYTKMVFTTIFDTSRAYQSRFAHLSSNISEQIKEILSASRESFPSYATVACQGVQGAYSQLAAERLFSLCDITYMKTFEGVFNAVQSGLCEYGILPIENSSVGSVNSVYDLMRKYNFYIVRSLKLPIRHSLLAKKGTRIEDIKEIISHEQGINQCSGLIKRLGNVKITFCDNTAIAAKTVRESDRTDIAAISSRLCAELYDLAVLENGIQDNDSNFTRFICISKSMKIYSNANKISMIVNLPHEPGSLNKLLSKFTALGLSLSKIESIPLPNTDFEFMFYLDFEADIEREEVQNLLAELDNGSEQFIFLGSYNEVI
ncbi:MAG TPA: prephenate dehydratase domain-containing protein [Clostridia bacterium]|nr:prephenate dehydratase domain-containing protein [Clostridia bacterium]